MGVVWKAMDTSLDREVAIKVLPEATARAIRSASSACGREAKAIAALDHPQHRRCAQRRRGRGLPFHRHAVRRGRDARRARRPWRRVDGAPLRARDSAGGCPQRGAPAGQSRTATSNRPTSSSRRTGAFRVLDFGLAKPTVTGPDDADALRGGDDRRHGSVHGAGAGAGNADRRARGRLFSLGVILHELATGERPFRGDNAVSVISSIMKDTPPDVTEVRVRAATTPRSHRPPRCLAKQPERRYQSALELRKRTGGAEVRG